MGMLGEEMLYYLNTQKMKKEDYELCILHLPEERRLRACKYVFDRDRFSCVFGYALVALGIEYEYGIHDILIWDYEEYGKPFFKDHKDICFNLSHSGYGVICGIDNNAIGVDIQEIMHYDMGVGEMILSDDEKLYLQSLDNPDVGFTEIWTLKESYVKMLGIGMDTDLKEISFDLAGDSFYKYGKYFEKRIIDNYVISYCASEPMEFCEVTKEALQSIYERD